MSVVPVVVSAVSSSRGGKKPAGPAELGISIHLSRHAHLLLTRESQPGIFPSLMHCGPSRLHHHLSGQVGDVLSYPSLTYTETRGGNLASAEGGCLEAIRHGRGWTRAGPAGPALRRRVARWHSCVLACRGKGSRLPTYVCHTTRIHQAVSETACLGARDLGL
ncbi:hypothetical protein GGR56DRAFT_513112 [Xylariaceae sp. FL0804]|nr:hypothetical protein GGR56DRAFT_513112 [Xylariaceae sp. FL0804]